MAKKTTALPEKNFASLITKLRADKKRVHKDALSYAKPLAKCSPAQVKTFTSVAAGWLTKQHILRIRLHGLGKMSARLAKPTTLPIGVDRFKQLSKADQDKLNKGRKIPVYTPDGTRNKTVEEMTREEVARVFNDAGSIRKPDEQARIIAHAHKMKTQGLPIIDMKVVRDRVMVTLQGNIRGSMPLKRFGQKLKSSGVLEKLGIDPVAV